MAMIDYKLVRSKRRTLSLHIRDGAVEVRAPLKMPQSEIDRFVASKTSWITDKLTQSRARLAKRQAFTVQYGDAISLRGQSYRLTIKTGTRAGFDGAAFYLPPNLTPEQIKHGVVQIYRGLARQYFAGRVAHYAARMGVKPVSVKISGAKTRWGSCSTGGRINFSWRLVLADDEVIDYVVVHELAHLKEMNHSARFWALVTEVLPDYKTRQTRLKALQQRLNAEDWE